MAEGVAVKQAIGIPAPEEGALARSLTEETGLLFRRAAELESALASLPGGAAPRAEYCAQTVLPAMEAARTVADRLEGMVSHEFWPFPTYRDLLFYI